MGDNASQMATLAGGCFWCLEAVYNELRGVTSAISGYAGGAVVNPSYEQVCGGRTGHAEVVQVTFDPAVIDYQTLLDVFFTIHDPTTLNRQGHDVGTQYRSAIYCHTPAQHETAVVAIARLGAEKLWNAPIVTTVEPLAVFYPAEEYHQRYFERNPGEGYCRMVVAPKVLKARSKYVALLKG